MAKGAKLYQPHFHNASVIEQWPINRPKPYEKNPRRPKNDEAVSRLSRLIEEYGMISPIICDEHSSILAGHRRWLACKLLKRQTIPVIVRTGLTDLQKTAYRIADNSSSQFSEFDPRLLELELESIAELGGTLEMAGLTEAELSGILHPGEADEPQPEASQGVAGHSLKFADDAWETIQRAVYRIREEEQEEEIAEPRAVELALADWLAGK